MASSENLASIEPWTFSPGFADSWISEAFARDTETLTRALQKTISSSLSNPDSHLSFINKAATPTASNVSGSDPETAPKRQRAVVASPGATGKVSKRKSRGSKRTQTMFITADPANFRQMVQQVTGVKFGNVQMALSPILKPEPQRVGAGSGCLPTLDTSAFLLDHQQQPSPESSLLPYQSAEAAVASASASAAGTTIDSDTFASFPTLDSWKV